MLSRQLLGSILNPSIKYLKLAALMAAVFAHGPLIAEQMDSAYDLMARMANVKKGTDKPEPSEVSVTVHLKM